MTEQTGSKVYILNKNSAEKDHGHFPTLNDAKFYGLAYFYESEEPFYRFTKIPFPHLFYASETYLVYTTYYRLAEQDIPYTKQLTSHDEAMKENMSLFRDAFGKNFVYNPDARAKYRDPSKRKKKQQIRKRASKEARIKHFNKHY